MKAQVLVGLLTLLALTTRPGVDASASQVLRTAAASMGAAAGHDLPQDVGGHWEQIYEEKGLEIGPPGERTAVAGPDDTLHAVYGGRPGLYYAQRVEGQWLHELVDAGPAANPSIAFATGGPRICYRGGDGSKLYYAWRDASGWHKELVGIDAAQGSPCSIATAATGEVGIAYSAQENVMYVYRGAAGWQVESAAAGRADYLSLVVSGTGRAYLAFSRDCDYGSPRLAFAFRDAAGWHQEEMGDQASCQGSLAVTPAGSVLLAYLALADSVGSHDAIIFATRSDAGWERETVTTGDHMRYLSLALDASATPYVALYEEARPGLRYSQRLPDGWHEADTGRRVRAWPYHVTLALAGSVPVVAECQGSGNGASLDVTTMEPAGALTEQVSRATYVGQNQKVAVEKNGRVHLVYSDGVHDQPMYAYQNASGWHQEVIRGASMPDGMAVDSGGRAHIAFADAAGVHYGLHESSGWRFELVRPAPAGTPNLVLDAGERPLLAWSDADRIFIAAAGSEEWAREAVDGAEGYAPLVALDGTGAPYLAYTDSQGQLRSAYRHEGAWYLSYPAASVGSVSSAASFLVSAQGTLYLGCFVIPDLGVYLTVRTGREWVPEILPEVFAPRGRVPLALDSHGNLSAAYLEGAGGAALMYARRRDEKWSAEIVDITATPLYEVATVSLSLDGEGRPVISYTNPDIRGIRVLRWVEETPATNLYLPLIGSR